MSNYVETLESLHQCELLVLHGYNLDNVISIEAISEEQPSTVKRVWDGSVKWMKMIIEKLLNMFSRMLNFIDLRKKTLSTKIDIFNRTRYINQITTKLPIIANNKEYSNLLTLDGTMTLCENLEVEISRNSNNLTQSLKLLERLIYSIDNGLDLMTDDESLSNFVKMNENQKEFFEKNSKLKGLNNFIADNSTDWTNNHTENISSSTTEDFKKIITLQDNLNRSIDTYCKNMKELQHTVNILENKITHKEFISSTKDMLIHISRVRSAILRANAFLLTSVDKQLDILISSCEKYNKVD